jgi:uncharacterized protein related to proFAR isomerase
MSLISRVIPVIDILHGQVVHGIAGNRSSYQPIQSRLTASTHPLDVAKAFHEVFGFTKLYVADLDAIRSSAQIKHNGSTDEVQPSDKTDCNEAAILAAAEFFDEVWLDSGWFFRPASQDDIAKRTPPLSNHPHIRHIIATEHHPSAALFQQALVYPHFNSPCIASIDTRFGEFFDPSQISDSNVFTTCEFSFNSQSSDGHRAEQTDCVADSVVKEAHFKKARECVSWTPLSALSLAVASKCQDTIWLSIDRVGTPQGNEINFGELGQATLGQTSKSTRIWLGGGIRNRNDLLSSINGGAHGVLSATALHNGSILPFDLSE